MLRLSFVALLLSPAAHAATAGAYVQNGTTNELRAAIHCVSPDGAWTEVKIPSADTVTLRLDGCPDTSLVFSIGTEGHPMRKETLSFGKNYLLLFNDGEIVVIGPVDPMPRSPLGTRSSSPDGNRPRPRLPLEPGAR
jgi:hypothetical protein